MDMGSREGETVGIRDLANAERETHLNMVAGDRDTWHVYSDDPVMMTRLERIGAKPVREESHGGKHYTLRADQLLLRKVKPKRGPLTKVQRTALAQGRV